MRKKSFISGAAALALAGSVCATPYTVDTLNDLPSDGECSIDVTLRDALDCAAANNGDTIGFDPGLLPGMLDINGSLGVVSIDKNVTISGPLSQDLNVTTTSGSSGLFEINASNVTLSNLTVSNFSTVVYVPAISVVSGGGLTLESSRITNNSDYYATLIQNDGSLTIVGGEISENAGIGEVIYNTGEITLNGVTVKNNQMAYTGVGTPLYNQDGNVTIIDSTLSGNLADPDGGTISSIGGKVDIKNSQLINNEAYTYGGAIAFSGTQVTIVDSNLSGNISGRGGGAVSTYGGTLDINDSVLSKNSSYYYGGAIDTYWECNVTIVGSTLRDNSVFSGEGPGKGGAIANNASNTKIINSVIAENNATDSAGGIYITSGSVLVVDSNLSGNVSGVVGGYYYYGGNGYGGAVANEVGDLNISGAVLEKNSAYYGGAIAHNYGNTVIVKSTLRENNASDGGAIDAGGGVLLISESTLRDNNATYAGGALSLWDGASLRVEINASTISGNGATYEGGGIRAMSVSVDTVSLNILNSTISGNTVKQGTGGGASFYGPALDVNISHSTFASNNAGDGGAFYSYDSNISIKSTIVADSNTTSDCYVPGAPLNSYGYNLVENNSSCPGFGNSGDINGDPGLLTLAGNGGPTLTHALAVGSPARGTGSSTDIEGNTVLTDQRGVERPPSLPSIGAFEPRPAALDLSTNQILFGSLTIGDTSSEYNVTIQSQGDDALIIDPVAIRSGSTDFSVMNYCSGITLQYGDTCNIGVSFTPSQSTEPYLEYLDINSSLTGVSAFVELQGEGTEAPMPYISVSPAILEFGDVNISETKNLSLTVSNGGSANLVIEDVSLLESTAAFSLDTAACSSEIEPEGSCTIGVGFTPAAETGYSDQLVITSNAGNTLSNIALTGNGTVVAVSGDINGSITLPSVFAAGVQVAVFIEAAGVESVVKNYTLSPEVAVPFSLDLPEGADTFRVGYYLYDALGSAVQKGYFTGTGTTAYRDEAILFNRTSLPSAVSLDILRGKSISGTVTLPAPAAEKTELEVSASVDVLGASALFRHNITTDVEFNAGQSSADYTLSVPESDLSTRYYITYDFFDSNDYIRQGYFSTTATTPYFSEATTVDLDDGNMSAINLAVLDGVSISGTASIVSASSLPTYLFIHAVREDGYETFGGADIPADGNSVMYRFDVPATAEPKNYKMGYYLFKNDGPQLADRIIGYWSSGGTVTNLEKAESFSLSDTPVTEKDFTLSDTPSQTLAVRTGWNLLSLPSKAEFTLFDMILHFGFNETGLVKMAKYSPSGWTYYMVKGQNAAVNRFDNLRSNEGFWLQSLYAFDLQLAFADDTEYADELAPLNKGWNLVGINREMTVSELVSLYQAKGYDTIESIWIYKNSTWYLYIPDVTLDAMVDASIPRIESAISRNDGIWINIKGE